MWLLNSDHRSILTALGFGPFDSMIDLNASVVFFADLFVRGTVDNTQNVFVAKIVISDFFRILIDIFSFYI